MEELNEHTYEAFVDPTTGLYDRRTMWSRLAEEVSRAHHYRYPLSLMLVSFGTPEAQPPVEHVQRLAETLKRYTRSSDILARYSEDTLAILLPCTDEEGALILAERVRRLAGAIQPLAGETSDATMVSIGVTCAPGDYSGDKVALVEQVEWALKKAREEGGESTVVVPVPGQERQPEEDEA